MSCAYRPSGRNAALDIASDILKYPFSGRKTPVRGKDNAIFTQDTGLYKPAGLLLPDQLIR